MKLPLRIRLPLILAGLLASALAISDYFDIQADEHHLVSKLDGVIHEDVEWVEVKLKTLPLVEAIDAIQSLSNLTNRRYRFQLTRSDESLLGGSDTDPNSASSYFWNATLPPLPEDRTMAGYNFLNPRGNFRVLDIPVSTLNGEQVWIRAISPRTDIDEHIRYLSTVKLLSKPTVILLTALAAYLLVKRALAPIKTISSLAKGLTLRDPAIYLKDEESLDEYDELIRILNEAYARLQDTSHRISNFTAEASHELRSPIAAIRVTSENAIRNNLDAFELRQSLLEINKESIHMTELVSQLLTLSRLESSERDSLNETVRVDYVLESLCDRYTRLAAESSIRFTVESLEPCEVLGDRIHLRQLFANLLDNALKFTPAGGAITISSRLEGAFWRMRIIDTGIGISKEHMPRIFDRFFRANASGKQETSGSGLGLPLCRAIATMHGGDVTAISEVGVGTTLEVTLPGTTPEDYDLCDLADDHQHGLSAK